MCDDNYSILYYRPSPPAGRAGAICRPHRTWQRWWSRSPTSGCSTAAMFGRAIVSCTLDTNAKLKQSGIFQFSIYGKGPEMLRNRTKKWPNYAKANVRKLQIPKSSAASRVFPNWYNYGKRLVVGYTILLLSPSIETGYCQRMVNEFPLPCVCSS